MTVEVQSFDVCGDLPGVGTTLLEASAGTGKTFTVAALRPFAPSASAGPLATVSPSAPA